MQRKLKFFSLATIWSQKNLIVETSLLHTLFKSTFQLQNVFSDVYTSIFVFVCFFVLVFVIVLAFSSKFRVSLFSFLFMLLFWSFQSKFMVSHACFGMSLHLKVGVSPKIFTTKSFYFLLTFTFLSTSIIFSFIPFCPLLSLSLSLPLSLAAVVAD